MKSLNFKTAFIFIFIIINTTVSAQDKTLLYEEFTPEKISSFICSLINNGEYYRAYVELLRLNSFYPSYINKPVFDVTSNYLYYKSKKYDDLLMLNNTQSDLFIPVSIFRIDSLIRLNRKDEAKSELVKLDKSNDLKDFASYVKKRKLFFAVLNNEKNNSEFSDYAACSEELFLFSETIHQDKKSPAIGLLSGIIPGMGYVYAGERGTGIVSMIIISAGTAVSYVSYRNGSESLALISGLITFFFYSGSIAGGYMQTVKYNNRLMETLELRLNRELMPEKDLDEIYFKFGLSSDVCR